MRAKSGYGMVAVCLGLAATAWAGPLGTGFTYQGKLTDGGNPANGVYDFQFRLGDAPVLGLLLGTVVVEDVTVADGLFTVTLDFGANVFDGDERWLDISVRPGNSGGAYTTLTPRQLLTVAPYALQTRGMFVDAANNATLVGQLFARPGNNFLGVGRDTRVTGSEYFGLGTPATGTNYGGMYISTSAATARPFYGYAAGGDADAYHWYDGTADQWRLYVSTGTHLAVAGSGEVGIGTVTPRALLHVQDASVALPAAALLNDVAVIEHADAVLGLYSSDGGSYGSALTLGEVASGALVNKWSMHRTTTGGGNDLRFAFGTNPDYSANDEVLTMTDTLRVGIGTTSPGAKLDVRNNDTSNALYSVNYGNGRAATFQTFANNANTVYVISGSTTHAAVYIQNTGGTALQVNGGAQVDILEITGADMAEKFPVREDAEPGMVMMIDADHPGQLCLAQGAYNRRVAGVVSGAGNLPVGAILGNLDGDKTVGQPIALSGRVWVWCDAGTHAIEPGDLLTTAERPGHAMAVTDHARAHGAVIGKAMTALAQGEVGLVLVLVNLQ